MTDTLAVARPARPSQRPARSPWWALAVVLTGQFMAVLDASVVNVAAPSIHASLHTSGAGLQLVIAGYVITYAVLLVTGARLGDILGHRRMFLAGLAVFTLASLGCGLATSTGVLVTLRFIQGAGAAAMIPQVLSLIQRTFTGAARGRPMRLYAAVLAGGAVTGQVVGGVLVSADLLGGTWRPVFLLNVPIGVLLFLAGLRTLPNGRGAPGRRPGWRPADPRPAAAAARDGGRDRGPVLRDGRVRRVLLRAGTAPAGRPGRLADAGRAHLRARRAGVRRGQPELAAPAGGPARRREHRRLRGLRCRAAAAGRRAARRRARRDVADRGPGAGRRRDGGRVQPADDRRGDAGPGVRRGRRDRGDRHGQPARPGGGRGHVRHALPEPGRPAAPGRGGRVPPGLRARGRGDRRGPSRRGRGGRHPRRAPRPHRPLTPGTSHECEP